MQVLPAIQSQDPHYWPIVLNANTLEAIERTKLLMPELFIMGEDALWKHLRGIKETPDAGCCMLRLRFWDEYARAEGGKMSVIRIYRDVCAEGSWERYLSNPKTLAWILTPVRSMMVQCQERIDTLMRNMRDVAAIAPVSEDGRVDLKLARLQFEMLTYFDQKQNGAIVQKIEQTNKSLTVTAKLDTAQSQQTVAQMLANMSEEDVLAKLKEFEQKKVLPKTIEMNPE